MEILRNSYHIAVSKDEKQLLNVAGTVSVFYVEGKSVKEMNRFTDLKNPSYTVFSNSEKMVAFNNTSGHIAVYSLETGSLLCKNKCMNEEGTPLYFVCNDTKIVAAGWNGTVYLLDISNNTVEIIENLNMHVESLLSFHNDNLYVAGTISLEFDEGFTDAVIFELSATDKSSMRELWRGSRYSMCLNSMTAVNDTIYFFASDQVTNQDDVFALHIQTGKVSSCLDFSVFLAAEDTYDKYGYFICLCVSSDEKFLLLGFSKAIIGFDLLEKRQIGTVPIEYLSSLHFISSDSQIIIGSWKKVEIQDFAALFPKD